jgi:hypothetical protein
MAPVPTAKQSPKVAERRRPVTLPKVNDGFRLFSDRLHAVKLILGYDEHVVNVPSPLSSGSHFQQQRQQRHISTEALVPINMTMSTGWHVVQLQRDCEKMRKKSA